MKGIGGGQGKTAWWTGQFLSSRAVELSMKLSDALTVFCNLSSTTHSHISLNERARYCQSCTCYFVPCTRIVHPCLCQSTPSPCSFHSIRRSSVFHVLSPSMQRLPSAPLYKRAAVAVSARASCCSFLPAAALPAAASARHLFTASRRPTSLTQLRRSTTQPRRSFATDADKSAEDGQTPPTRTPCTTRGAQHKRTLTL